jgi:hypothetical protein
MHWLCARFATAEPYRLTWLGTAPRLSRGALDDSMAAAHVMSAQRELPVERVVDRSAALAALEPDSRARAALFWNELHFHAEAIHYFNQELVLHLAAAGGWAGGTPMSPFWRGQFRMRPVRS